VFLISSEREVDMFSSFYFTT